jgi:hypothetical protein
MWSAWSPVDARPFPVCACVYVCVCVCVYVCVCVFVSNNTLSIQNMSDAVFSCFWGKFGVCTTNMSSSESSSTSRCRKRAEPKHQPSARAPVDVDVPHHIDVNPFFALNPAALDVCTDQRAALCFLVFPVHVDRNFLYCMKTGTFVSAHIGQAATTFHVTHTHTQDKEKGRENSKCESLFADEIGCGCQKLLHSLLQTLGGGSHGRSAFRFSNGRSRGRGF